MIRYGRSSSVGLRTALEARVGRGNHGSICLDLCMFRLGRAASIWVVRSLFLSEGNHPNLLRLIDQVLT